MGYTNEEKTHYNCDMCGEHFVSGWSDEEAADEKQQNFGTRPREGDAIVCTDCYEQVMEKISRSEQN